MIYKAPKKYKHTHIESLSVFLPCSAAEVRKLINMHCSHRRRYAWSTLSHPSCWRSLSTFFFRIMTAMINASLREGYLPPEINVPSLHCWKRPELEADDLKNYRPVSNLTCVSKLAESRRISRVVCYLNAENLMPQLQSAYRHFYSTETATLKYCQTSILP